MAKGIAHRRWTVDFRDYETVEDGRAAVQNEMALAEHIGERLGVAIIASPARERIDGSFVTRGWVFETASVPGIPDPEQEFAEVFEPEGALVEDGVPAEA